jgi:Tfp pilus assembly protein PilO
MKNKTFIYYSILIKENIIYILTNIVLIIVIGFILISFFKKSLENKNKIDQLQNEINLLTLKKNNLRLFTQNSFNIEKAIKILNYLVPNEEDYFSILYALENLSKKTGFQITSYAVNLSEKNPNRLRLTISGVGNIDTFFNFLKEYNFSGKRLITSDNLSLSSEQKSGYKIDLIFYNKQVADQKNLSTSAINDPNFFKKINDLLAKTDFILKESSEEAILNTNYPRKENPFSIE